MMVKPTPDTDRPDKQIPLLLPFFVAVQLLHSAHLPPKRKDPPSPVKVGTQCLQFRQP